MAILAFDIEISNVFDLGPGEDLERYAPFDISVAATHLVGGEERLWLSRGADGRPATNLSRADAAALLGYLETMQKAGHAILAWNGLSFDLRWLGHAAGDLPAARRIALRLYDPMYQFFKLKGFPIALAKAGEGLGIPMRKLMDGADAPRRWRAGDHGAVCEYVKGDARMTAQVAEAITSGRRITWVTQRGTRSSVPITALRPVEECMALPMPDQSWMDAPLSESKFIGWLR